MYLTYDEYTEMGGTLDEATFKDLEFEARSYVDWYTFSRLKNENIIPLQVKECMYYLIRLIFNKMNTLNTLPTTDSETSTTGGSDILSQSNDGVSITYNKLSSKEMLSSLKDEIADSINRYLQGVTNSLGKKLLYRGLYPGE